MKLLHVIRTLNPAWGGTVEAVRSLALQGQKHGVDSEIVCMDDETSEWLASWNVPVYALGKVPGNYGRSKSLDAWLDRHIQRFDAVLVNGIWMYFSRAARKAAKKHEIPYYLYIHGALDPWFKKKYPLKQIKKWIYWILYEHRVLRDARATLFTTEEERTLAHKAFLPYVCRPLVTGFGIPDPSSSYLTAPSKQLAALGMELRFEQIKGRRILLFLARIHEKKGIDLLLQAFSRLQGLYPNHVLLIAGPGPDTFVDLMKEQARKLRVSDQVIWTGPLYGQLKWLALQAAEAYILPSHQENFGISVVEALACSTPVLISDKVNIWREIQRDGGGIVASDDLTGTMGLLQRWINLSRDEQAIMAGKAQCCYQKNFDIASSCTRLFDLLTEDETAGHLPLSTLKASTSCDV